MKNPHRLAVAGVALLSACATPVPISNNPVQEAAGAIGLTQNSAVVKGLQNAEWNLDQAVSINILAANDPADQCLHQTLTNLGQELAADGTPVPSTAKQFTPRMTGLIDGGSVVYILAQQAKKVGANPGALVPASCEQIVGHFVIAGLNAPANAVLKAGVNLIP